LDCVLVEILEILLNSVLLNRSDRVINFDHLWRFYAGDLDPLVFAREDSLSATDSNQVVGTLIHMDPLL
jgi:hypothetical protein